MKKNLLLLISLTLLFAGITIADEIKGKITIVDSEKNMVEISGVKIDLATAWMEDTQDFPLKIENLKIDDYVEIDGKFLSTGVFKANKLEEKEPQCGEINGKITAIDYKRRAISINSVKVMVANDAWLEGPSEVKIPIQLLAVGYKIACKGNWTGKNELTAFKVEVE